ncbi:helix-turn-helix transcriptional regulator [Mesorhizobium sp. SP-1A]|uniref:helix-turn-helix transcriptional regulator n=1 Tax=Mesorhizobium sp. SP-1A TaxID=3077840 RepID=UPI0028F74BFD|nr:helix-turn-helix transcriptional regulator [Mesorhizobium sp. SP-1A]
MAMDEAGAVAMFGQIAESLGTPRFHRGVLDIVRKFFPSDFAQVYQIDRNGRAVCIDPCDTPENACRSYEQQFSLDCPLSRYWQSTGRLGVVAMHEVRSRYENYGNYFSDFYHPMGLVDEIGVLLPSPGRRTVALFMERTRSFNADTAEAVRRFYSGITRLHRANNQLIFRNAVIRKARGVQPNAVAILDRAGDTVFANREWRQACQSDSLLESTTKTVMDQESASLEIDCGTVSMSRLDESFAISPGGRLCVLDQNPTPIGSTLDAYKSTFLKGQVSRREHEIICAMLDGYPTKAIAERVGCALETVKAHKKRIYHRLDITTEREIFLMFLEHLQGRGMTTEATH